MFQIEIDASRYAKETLIHTNHQPFKYLQTQTKLQQSQHYRWMGILQQVHLVIQYKEGTINKVDDMFSSSYLNISVNLKIIL